MTIIGCGLIGGPIAHAARRQNVTGEIVVTDLTDPVRSPSRSSR